MMDFDQFCCKMVDNQLCINDVIDYWILDVMEVVLWEKFVFGLKWLVVYIDEDFLIGVDGFGWFLIKLYIFGKFV